MKSIPPGGRHVPGTWKELTIYDRGEQVKSATITCPDCGQVGCLMDHEILPDGTVQPSVVCPTEGCPFHEFVKLEGWKES